MAGPSSQGWAPWGQLGQNTARQPGGQEGKRVRNSRENIEVGGGGARWWSRYPLKGPLPVEQPQWGRGYPHSGAGAPLQGGDCSLQRAHAKA